MPRLSFTQNLQRHVASPPAEVDGTTVREVLESHFAAHPEVRSYIVDDQGSLRPHMAIFVWGELIRDRAHLSDPVGEHDSVQVFQALSGG